MPENQNQQSNGIQPVSKLSLRLGYWYLSNKKLLRQTLIGFLIALSIILYSYSLYRAVTIVVIDDKNLQKSLNQLTDNEVNFSNYHRINSPVNLEILRFDVASAGEGRYDFIAKIKNPNVNFSASRAVFQLVAGSTVVKEHETFVLPGEEKYVTVFGAAVPAGAAPELRAKSIDWDRQRNYQAFAANRLDFSVANINFIPAGRGVGTLPVSILTFDITNNTAFSYWEVGVHMVLLSGDQVVGANYTTLESFESGETRNVEMRWHESLPRITGYEVLPEINILDDAVYMGL